MSAGHETGYLKSGDAAKRLGIRTRTLARWRQLRRGPRGWVRLSATTTLYPEWGLTEFMEERSMEEFVFNFQRKSAAAGNASELG